MLIRMKKNEKGLMNEKSDSNPGYDRNLFCERTKEAMSIARVDYEMLAERFCEAGYKISQSNLKVYINQRSPSLKLLTFLSKTLNVSIDWLIGNEAGNLISLNEGFDREIYGSRYAQFPGSYTVYFYPTRTNHPEKLHEARLCISAKNGFYTTLELPIEDGETKKFSGHLILSKKTPTAFLTMVGQNGEIIQFVFNDPGTNRNKLRFCIAALVSVSSGDSKRMPTLSRAVISELRLTDAGHRFLDSHLLLNSKLINIHEDALKTVLDEFVKREDISNAEEVHKRLTYAFKARTYHALEEQYILNTFRYENNLTNLQTETLIAELRKHSMADINVKVPRTLDARLYLMLREENMFVVPSDGKVEES